MTNPSALPINHISRLNTQPAPCQRFKCGVATPLAGLGAGVTRYVFTVWFFRP